MLSTQVTSHKGRAPQLGRTPLDTPICRAIGVHVRRPGWLRATGGALWVTRPNVLQDIVIAAGEWHFLVPGRGVVIEPMHHVPSTRIAWCPLTADADTAIDKRPQPLYPAPWFRSLMFSRADTSAR